MSYTQFHDTVVTQTAKMLLEKNGRSSCSKRTKHIDVRYFYITDQVDKKEVSIEHCPTGEMLADFFTKPLQGELFRKFRAAILNLENGSPQESLTDPERTTGVCCETSPSRPTSRKSSTSVDQVHVSETSSEATKKGKMVKGAVAH